MNKIEELNEILRKSQVTLPIRVEDDDVLVGYDSELIGHTDGATRKELRLLTEAVNNLPMLLEAVELLKVAAHALETPGDFTPEELQEQVLGDIGAFLSKLEM